MVFVSGRVEKLVRNHEGVIEGFTLEDGREVRLATDLHGVATSVITRGCLVGFEGSVRDEGQQDEYFVATLITNLDSRQSSVLPDPNHKGKPGMRSNVTPNQAASLALDSDPISTAEVSSPGHEGHASDSAPLRPASFFLTLTQEADPDGMNAARNAAARSITFAYDSLHRIQAVLAYLHIMKRPVSGISQFLDEAKHTYVQALTRFGAADFTGAKEFAEASAGLSCIVEIVMTRAFRSDSMLPSLVPPPPPHLGSDPDGKHVEEILARTESVLSRLHWVLHHGTLPSEDRAQVRKIASWGDAFFKQAQKTYRDSVLEDASEFAQAALAGANSAEHVCREWYVHRCADR